MRALLFLLLLTLGACCCGVVDSTPEPEYVDVVRYDGRYYLLYRDEPLQPQDGGQLLGPEHTRVLRLVEDCPGVRLTDPGIDDSCDLRDGDSNRLPAQTSLHSVGEFSPAQVLGATHDGRYLLFAAYFPPD
jgi:hypothetical protein